jgi:hypothetical protein
VKLDNEGRPERDTNNEVIPIPQAPRSTSPSVPRRR